MIENFLAFICFPFNFKTSSPKLSSNLFVFIFNCNNSIFLRLFILSPFFSKDVPVILAIYMRFLYIMSLYFLPFDSILMIILSFK